MKIKGPHLEKVTVERRRGWEGAKVENEAESCRGIKGEKIKKWMKQMLEADVWIRTGRATVCETTQG